MSIYKKRKGMIFNRIKDYKITDSEWKIKRMTGVIIKFSPTDEELEKGLIMIKDGIDRYLVNSLEGYTYKVFNTISMKVKNESK